MSTAYTFLNLASMWEFCAKSGKASPALWDTYANDWVQTDFPAVIPKGRSFSQYYATVGTEIVTEFGGHLVMLDSGLWYGDVGNMTQVQRDALAGGVLATGTRATVGTTEYTYQGAAVGWKTSVTAPFDSYAALNAALPPGVRGRSASVKQIAGPGDFKVYDTGTRWAVCGGEAIISDTVEVTINADAGMVGVYQTLASYAIPAGLIGEGEIWEWADGSAQSAGTVAAFARITTEIITNVLASNIQYAGTNNLLWRTWRRFKRVAGVGIKRSYTSLSVDTTQASSASAFNSGIDFSTAQTLSWQTQPGSATDVVTLQHFALRRAA